MRNKWTPMWEGQITVFILMIFMLIVSLLGSLYQSAIYYACRSDARQAAWLSVDGIFAGYQKELRDRYGILAYDGGFGQGDFLQDEIENRLLRYFEWNMQSSMINNQVKKTSLAEEPIFTFLIDGDWELFVREIKINHQQSMIEEGVTFVVEQWQKKNDEASGEFLQKRQNAENAGDKVLEDTEEKKEQQAVDDPRDSIMSIWNKGILKAACPNGFAVSEKEISISDVSYPEASEKVGTQIDLKNEANIQNLFTSWKKILKPKEIKKLLEDDWAVQSYVQKKFSNAVNQVKLKNSEKQSLDYEIEYIIGGNASDYENLKVVLWKLMAIRCVFNLSYLISSVEKENQVMTTAIALSSVLLIPQFTEVIAFGLKFGWAFAESLADCRTLLKGGKVPLMKNDNSWYLTWESMLELQESMLDGNSNQDGLDYTSYLQILLAFTNRDIKYKRMTHLMEKNIRMMPGCSGFRMKNCIYGIQVVFLCDLYRFNDYKVQMSLSY